jgi:hypothetical protein
MHCCIDRSIGHPTCSIRYLEAMREAFRCSVIRVFLGGWALVPPCLVHGEDALRINATVPFSLWW